MWISLYFDYEQKGVLDSVGKSVKVKDSASKLFCSKSYNKQIQDMNRGETSCDLHKKGTNGAADAGITMNTMKISGSESCE
jgi:hypothetical protein